MGWNSTDRILTAPFTKIAAGGSGDLQLALRRSVKSHIQLVGDVDSGGNRVNSVNIFAKYKPFRNQRVLFSASAEKLSARRAARFGTYIPRYGANDFKTHYSEGWAFLPPRGAAGTGGNNTNYNEPYRAMDFDGYNANEFQEGTVDNKMVATVFNGNIRALSNRLKTGGKIFFELQCSEDPDTGIPGLIFPNDFDINKYSGLTDDGYDLSQYYIGVALIFTKNSQPSILVKTGDKMITHDPDPTDPDWDDNNSIYAELEVTLPSDDNMPLGNFVAVPVLAQNSTSGSWTSSPVGYLVSINGAYLPLEKVNALAGLDINVTITPQPANNRVALDFSVENVSAENITISKLFAYLMSADSYYDEPETSGYPAYGLGSIEPSTDAYIWNTWPSTPELTTQGDRIVLSDRTGQGENPNPLCAYGYNAYADYLANNPNTGTNVIRPGSANKVTWTKYLTINRTGNPNTLSDDYGDYSENAFLDLGIQISPNQPFVIGFSMN